MSRATPKDLGLALAAALIVAQGPFTPAALGPSIFAGAVAAGLVLYYRLSWIPKVAPQQKARATTPWNVPPSVWVCLGAFALLGAPTLGWMYSEWTGSVWHNSHGLLIPILMIMLGRNTLRRMPKGDDTPSKWGFAFLVPGLALLALDSGAATRYVSSLGFVTCLPGFSLLLLGARRTKALSLPLTLGIFMIPLPNTVASQIYLRTLTAQGVGPVLNVIGIPTFVNESVLELSHTTFLVANTCSGFSTLYATVAMAVLLGTLCKSIPRRILIYISIVPLALLANILRVVVLVLIFLYIDPGLLDTSMHAASGVATFFVVLFALIVLAKRPSLSHALL